MCFRKYGLCFHQYSGLWNLNALTPYSHTIMFMMVCLSLFLWKQISLMLCVSVWLFGGINVFLELQCSSCSFVYFFSWHAVHSVANCSSLCTVVVVWVFAVTPSFRCVFFFKAPTHVRSFFSVVLCFLVYFGIQQKKTRNKLFGFFCSSFVGATFEERVLM